VKITSAFPEMIGSPTGEEIGGVAFGLDDGLVEAHVILTVPTVQRVAVHHVAQEPVEEIQAPQVRGVGRGESKVPFPDQRGVVPDGAEMIGDGGDGGMEPAPGIGGLGPDDTGHADAIGVSTGEEGGAGGRTDSRIGTHPGEAHALGGKPVDVGGPDVGIAVGRDIADAMVIGEDEQEVGRLGEGGEEEGQEGETREDPMEEVGEGKHGGLSWSM
jgi:hypothetical protein